MTYSKNNRARRFEFPSVLEISDLQIISVDFRFFRVPVVDRIHNLKFNGTLVILIFYPLAIYETFLQNLLKHDFPYFSLMQ